LSCDYTDLLEPKNEPERRIGEATEKSTQGRIGLEEAYRGQTSRMKNISVKNSGKKKIYISFR
jgi:hypothetical protein